MGHHQGIWVLGGHQSDFARNWSRPPDGVDTLTAELVAGALEDAGVASAAIDAVHVANAFGQLFTGQGHLGAMVATVEPDLAGRPATRHDLGSGVELHALGPVDVIVAEQ